MELDSGSRKYYEAEPSTRHRIAKILFQEQIATGLVEGWQHLAETNSGTALSEAYQIAAMLFEPLGELIVAQHKNKNADGEFISWRETCRNFPQLDPDQFVHYRPIIELINQLAGAKNQNEIDEIQGKLLDIAIQDVSQNKPIVLVLLQHELNNDPNSKQIRWAEPEFLVIEASESQQELVQNLSARVHQKVGEKLSQFNPVNPNERNQKIGRLYGKLLAYAGWGALAQGCGEAFPESRGYYFLENMIREVDRGLRIAQTFDPTITKEDYLTASVAYYLAHEEAHLAFPEVANDLLEILPDIAAISVVLDLCSEKPELQKALFAAVINDLYPYLNQSEPDATSFDRSYYLSAIHFLNCIADATFEPNAIQQSIANINPERFEIELSPKAKQVLDSIKTSLQKSGNESGIKH